MILVIDDDPDTAFLVATHLERAGFVVETVGTINDALAQLPHAEAIVSDRNLGDDDALLLFKDGRPSTIKFAILVTGDDVPQSQAQTAGFDDVARKPVDAAKLIARLKAVVS